MNADSNFKRFLFKAFIITISGFTAEGKERTMWMCMLSTSNENISCYKYFFFNFKLNSSFFINFCRHRRNIDEKAIHIKSELRWWIDLIIILRPYSLQDNNVCELILQSPNEHLMSEITTITYKCVTFNSKLWSTDIDAVLN